MLTPTDRTLALAFVALSVVALLVGYWLVSLELGEPDYQAPQAHDVVILPGDDIMPPQIVPMDGEL